LIKRQKNDGILPEDQMKKLEKVIQDMTDKSCKEADELSQAKEKEVMTV
jgi:ribosome recycling factor